MAKQKGVFPLVGTIGGINFYYLNGKPVARMAGGGFNGEAIKTKASMERVRENSSEFGHCSQVNKIFRKALRPFYVNYKFTFFHSRLMRLFTKLKNLDAIHGRGQRRVFEGAHTSTGQTLIEQFDFTPDCQIESVLPFDFDMDWNTFSFSFPKFNIHQVSFISGATHIALQFGVLDFNFETLEYALYLSDPLHLQRTFLGTSISMNPINLPTGPGLGTCQAVLGVRYYQDIGGKLYLLNAHDGVGIKVVSIHS